MLGRFPLLWKSGLIFVVGFLLSLGLVISCSRPATIVVASKNFTEQVILGELLSQLIEQRTYLKVDRKLNLGGTQVCHEGLKSGSIDVYVEYTGTALTAVLKQKPLTDPRQVYQQVQQAYAQQLGLEWTEPLGFNNTFAMVIRREEAQQFKLQSLSQAATYSPKWRVGVGYEFLDRPDGLPGLMKTYGLQFAEAPKVMDLGLLYQALTEKQVDLVAGNSTDGLISRLNLVILQDDRQYFPPYEAAPVIRQETLKRYPALRQVLRDLGGKISNQEMQQLNDQVDGDRQEVKQVVQAFLQKKGLLSESK